MARTQPFPAAHLMGLIIGAAVAMLAWSALWRTRKLNAASLQLLGAALLAGLAGYAFQGRTGLLGSPAGERAVPSLPPAMPIPLAEEFFGRFTGAYSWLVIANAFLAHGNSSEAVATLASATRARPADAELWIAFANALRIHGGGRISPAARLAYEHAAQLAPDHPAPAFFFGLASVQSGDVATALSVWKQLLANAPPGSRWGEALKLRIALLEQVATVVDARRLRANQLKTPSASIRRLPTEPVSSAGTAG